ncbi:MAG: F0F1 ATP synthase subunit A [Phaeodactylibacter sp.]|nr:F0F1 ATP synthase subunit A [Phaeodactylibacter sp.]
MQKLLFSLALLLGLSMTVVAQNDHHGQDDHSTETHSTTDDHADHGDHNHADHGHDAHAAAADHGHADGCPCHEGGAEVIEDFDVTSTAFHHIGDANAFHVWGDIYVPLPCFLYSNDAGWTITMASAFEMGEHGNGHLAIDRYVMVEGSVHRIADANFPLDKTEVCIAVVDHDGHKEYLVNYKEQCYTIEGKSTLDGGVFGGGFTSYYDFSITKKVFTMFLVAFLLVWMFTSIAKAYKQRQGQAPRGMQGFMEPIILFLRDEVVHPFIGEKGDKYLPFILTLFFFILGLNLIGQIPFFPGSANVTGNLGVTLVLAIFAFLVTNLSGNKHYWEHIFWMPGVPAWVKTILTPVEFMGVFLKPFTLMLRLFANITAGHIVMVSFIGLIFIFGESGRSVGGSIGGALASIPLTMFMMAIELLVAFIQAFVFALLTASYIGAAVEEPHHH